MVIQGCLVRCISEVSSRVSFFKSVYHQKDPNMFARALLLHTANIMCVCVRWVEGVCVRWEEGVCVGVHVKDR